MAERSKAMKSKIVPGKDLGQPKAVTLLPDGKNSLLMGTIMGRVEKVITRTMPNGDIYEGLSGFFEAIPSNPELPIVQSGICYLPTGFLELLTGPLKKAQEANPAAYLDFIFEVEAVKDSNPQGYTWRYTPRVATTSADPLAHLRGPNPQAQIADQTPPAKQPEAAKEPARAAGSHKR